jgi:transketolase
VTEFVFLEGRVMAIAEQVGTNLQSKELDELCVKTIRMLAVDAVQKANSGHPGLPMGCADFAYVLFTQFMRFDPTDPAWINRDRFLLSAGHGSMLLYAILHLSGFDVSMDEIKSFRQFGSITPGHPEVWLTPGVEATTGPLGQGIGNSVGVAIAEEWLAAQFNVEKQAPVDHFTYVLASDGDLMEGISHEAASTAGHLGLGKLIVFYDSNHISIEGETSLAYSENTKARFTGYNWHVQEIDGLDRGQIATALKKAQRVKDKPSIIVARTIIGYGSPNKANSHDVHGSPLGEEEVKNTKRNIGWPEDEKFLVPEPVRARFAEVIEKNKKGRKAWDRRYRAWRRDNAEKADLWDRCMDREYPKKIAAELAAALPSFPPGKSVATRKSAGQALEALMKKIPNLIGGSADLAPSTNTYIKEYGSFSRENRGARNFHFGVREHGMGAILNGLIYHGGIRPFGATFLTFSDYMRPSIRLAALSDLDPIYVFTHDSIFLGEDGPTHQPIEHFAALRSIPHLVLIRPGDAAESAYAWLAALQNTHAPTALILTRQNLPVFDRTQMASAEGVLQGGYVLTGEGELTIIATGSELSLAVETHTLLEKAAQIRSRVVSLPSWEIFDRQPDDYRKQVLGSGPRMAIEAGVRQGWDHYIGADGLFIGMDRFGASAPYEVLAEKFGFTAPQVVERVKTWLSSR